MSTDTDANTERFDPGLQPERTELAWRRTALTIAVGSLVALRLLPTVLENALWVIPGCVGIIAAFVMWVLARRRFTGIRRALVAEGTLPRGGAGAVTAMAIAVLAFGLFGLVVVAA